MLAALETFGDLLADEDVVSFVDNQGALGVLVSGSSSDRPMGRMAHEAALVQRRMRARFFYEYVNSAANIADLPSRGAAAEAARKLRNHFRVPVWYRPMKLPRLNVA